MKINLNYLLFVFLFTVKSVLATETYEITAKKVVFEDDRNIIIAEGEAHAISEDRNIYADKIIYFKSKNSIKTSGNSKFKNNKIELSANKFDYNIIKKIIVAEGNGKIQDKEQNKIYFTSLEYSLKSESGKAKNIKSYLNDGSFLSSETGHIDTKEQLSSLNKAIYTTCSDVEYKQGKICPTWSLKSKKIIHDKKKQLVKHSHSLLRIKNIPVLYLPKLSHPDPSVKRKSGFLPPLIKTISSLGRTIKIPYFFAISEDKDITLNPIYYFDEHPVLQTSYRQSLKNGFLKIENAYTKGYKNFEKQRRTSGSRNYFFLDYTGTSNNTIFKNNEINFKIQRVSQSNFLKVNKFNTKLFKEDIKSLENTIKIISYNDKKKLEFKTGIFENLDINDSKKYTYYFPEGQYSQNIRKKKFNANFNSFFQGQKFLDNQKQAKIRNKFLIDSNQYIFKNNGISSSLKGALYNNNIYNDNVDNLKNKENIDNYFTVANNISLPLIKISKSSSHILEPRMFLKYTSGKMLDATDEDKILNFSDIFSMNRTNNLDKPEVGSSLGYGITYNYKKKNISNSKINIKNSFGIGQVLRTSEENKMPVKSSLNKKSSDYAGFFKFNFSHLSDENLNIKNNNNYNTLSNKNFFVKYDFNINDSFNKFNKNTITLNSNYNTFNANLIFDEKAEYVGTDRYVTLSLDKKFRNNYNFGVQTKKDLKNDRSEYNKIYINYENDCIVTSLALSKEFYSDKDISDTKTLIFSILIKPFSDSFGPDLTDFIN